MQRSAQHNFDVRGETVLAVVRTGFVALTFFGDFDATLEADLDWVVTGRSGLESESI